MKKWHLSCFLICALGFSSCTTNYRLSKIGVYREVSAEKYLELLNRENVNIIDVRTKSEFRKTHIKGAVNASYLSGHFSQRVSDYKLDTTKQTLIYCETQHRSPLAANKLYKLGFKDIVDLKRGMHIWRKQKFPYQTSTDQE